MTNFVWYTVEMRYQQNVLNIILLMNEHNKKARYVDIYPVMVPPPGDFCVGLDVQASIKKLQENWNLISYYRSGGAFVGSLLGPSVLS